jgi:hypothetical protein
LVRVKELLAIEEAKEAPAGRAQKATNTSTEENEQNEKQALLEAKLSAAKEQLAMAKLKQEKEEEQARNVASSVPASAHVHTSTVENTQDEEQALLEAKLRAMKEQLAMAKLKQEKEEQVRNAASSVPAAAPATASRAPPSTSTGSETVAATDEVTTYYSAAELKKRAIPGLDYPNREKYLSPEEFKNLFKMSKEVFAEMPKWKQTKEKRKLKMF